MYPTLELGARLMTLGLKGAPDRGEVITFKYPERPDQMFLKRVVGLPGDRIQTKGKALLINGAEVPRCVVGQATWTSTEESRTGELALETLGKVSFLTFLDERAFQPLNGEWLTQPGEYFVMGDNRLNSHDSRMWFGGQGGGVPTANLEGRWSSPKATLPRALEQDPLLVAGLRKCLEGKK
jgi:signal peptidase I